MRKSHRGLVRQAVFSKQFRRSPNSPWCAANLWLASDRFFTVRRQNTDIWKVPSLPCTIAEVS